MPHPYYLLAIINSKLISWYHLKRSPKAKKGLFPKLLVTDLKNIPIRLIEIDNSEDTKIHNEIVTLVESMINLNKQISEDMTPDQKKILQ